MDPLDWNALRENCAGDDDLVNEVLELFRTESGALLGDVRSAVTASDSLAVKKTAHRLKGALVSLGAGPSMAAARELERLGSEGAQAKFASAFGVLETEMARLMATLSVAHAA